VSTVNDIPEQYLWCRDVMHSWDPYDYKQARNKVMRRNEMHQILRCARCATLKTRVMTASGDMLRSYYVYPDGYLLKDHGPMTPADRAMIRSINIKAGRKAVKDETE